MSTEELNGYARVEVAMPTLREYMIRVYNLMMLAIGVTGLVAYGIGHDPHLVASIFHSWISVAAVIVVPFILMFLIFWGLEERSSGGNVTLLMLFAAAMGVMTSVIFVRYTGVSIAKVFFISASVFAAASLYGYTTKNDLTGIGSLCFMGLIGLVIAGFINVIFHSSVAEFVISAIGVIIFVGLTAWDTQETKEYYDNVRNADDLNRFAVVAALNLYLDFLNIFLDLLRLIGDNLDWVGDVVSSFTDD